MRSSSLQRGSDFQRVWEHGKSWSDPFVVLRASPNGTSATRFGFVVGKKLGKAVERNRAKRWMRESVRRRRAIIAKGWDIILIARREVDQTSFQAVDSAIEGLLRRARLISGV